MRCGIDRFALVGHDWGGAVAWAAALRGDPRIERLAIVNSPHPAIFQQIADRGRRAARRLAIYPRLPRPRAWRRAIEAMGIDAFFDKSFAGHVDLATIDPAERAREQSPSGAARAR